MLSGSSVTVPDSSKPRDVHVNDVLIWHLSLHLPSKPLPVWLNHLLMNRDSRLSAVWVIRVQLIIFSCAEFHPDSQKLPARLTLVQGERKRRDQRRLLWCLVSDAEQVLLFKLVIRVKDTGSFYDGFNALKHARSTCYWAHACALVKTSVLSSVASQLEGSRFKSPLGSGDLVTSEMDPSCPVSLDGRKGSITYKQN